MIGVNLPPRYRLLNWNRLRAPARPYFFRSLIRASRVSNPAFLRAARRLGSNLMSARAIPRRSAPAWPAKPPPRAVARISTLSLASVRLNGSTICLDAGYHPCCALPGYEMYYFTILGGLSQRSLKQYFQPTHAAQLHTIPGIMDMVAKFK